MSRSDERAAESTAVAESARYRRESVDLRRTLEVVGVSLVGVLGALMIGFVALDWIRHYPYAGTVPGLETLYAVTQIDPAAGVLFEQVLIAGMWVDHFLGTNVFQHAFMWRSIATGVLVGIVAPLVGTYLVHRQMALIGETLAHTAFAGVAIGLLVTAVIGFDGSLLFVALVVSILGALAVQWLSERTSTFGDVPIAIMLAGSFAVGTLLISWGRGFMSVAIDIEGFLFGSLAVVTADGARMMAVLSVAVVAIVAYTYKQLLFITFDEQAARVAQLNVSGYNTLLVVMTAVVVVGAMQVLGVILVAGMLVIPVAAASQVARSFRETLYLSILIGQASILGGFAFAIGLSLPSGGSIIVVAILFYLLSIALSILSDRSSAAISMH
ncbi:metal ABC transporter permease [Natrarchaeobius oligotrophus]|uniref:Metal ABC transporter permease n=1 Tax=Natrarchaeobius chitinivorans TaxID=1679083 RepID=A0A3N6MND0_NATCH|nr:metal ABC transporter permease [Natrarchaeobius chitinivorans]RQH03155.1 metal ABC transporter permease [Natrarchaeobius chitinivorans]